MKVSVIIATYGRNACLVDTIRSVFLQDYPDFELIVVDQSPDHTPEVESFLKSVEDPRYSYYLIAPPSLPAARNFGLTRAAGKLVIYVDDDVHLEPGFIQAHLRALEASDRIAAVGGRVRGPGDAISPHLPQLLREGSWSGGFNYTEPGELVTVMGCNMSFHRTALEEVGGFDPSYEGNALREESDVCFRLRRRGYRISFEPKAALDHMIAPLGGCREVDLWATRHYFQNEALFHFKNLGLGRFCTTFAAAFKNLILPYKYQADFLPRLNAYISGVLRAVRLTLFPKKLQPKVVWELNRNRDLQAHEKV